MTTMANRQRARRLAASAFAFVLLWFLAVGGFAAAAVPVGFFARAVWLGLSFGWGLL
jgi:hypothetical protein